MPTQIRTTKSTHKECKPLLKYSRIVNEDYAKDDKEMNLKTALELSRQEVEKERKVLQQKTRPIE